MTHRLEPLFYPRSIAFIGGTNIVEPLRYQRELGFPGKVWAVHPSHGRLDQYDCAASVPEPPDLAFAAIRREQAIEVIAELQTMPMLALMWGVSSST